MSGSEELGQLKVLLSAQTAEYIQELEKARGASKTVGDDVKESAFGIKDAWGVLTGAGAVTVAALGAVAGATSYLIGEASAAQEAQAQLNAVLASTGGVAGVTAEMANELAGSWQDVSRYGDETVLSAESLMLTFTQIGKEIFPDAITAALDMSTALKQDLQGSVTMVSKALNVQAGDVTMASTAMNAMRRVGVAFTSEQVELAKQLVATGDVMGYQKLILGELQTEFGGSAVAAGQTLAGAQEILANKLSDVAETWGGALLPIAQEFVEGVTPSLIDGLNVLTTVELPKFVELVEKSAEVMMSAFEAGMLIVTWNDRVTLAYAEQTAALVTNTQSYTDYVAGVLDAAVAAGTLHSQWVEMHGAAVQNGEVTDQMRITLGLLTEEEYNQAKQVASLDAAYAAAGVTAYTWTEANQEAASSMSEATTQAVLLEIAIASVTENFDLAKEATSGVESAIQSLATSETEATTIKTVLQLATEDLTAAQIEEKLNLLEQLNVIQQLNTDIAAGTITHEEFYNVILGGVTTMEGYNETLGYTNNTLSETEAALLGAKTEAKNFNSELTGLDGKVVNVTVNTTYTNSGGSGTGTGYTGNQYDIKVGGLPGDVGNTPAPNTIPSGRLPDNPMTDYQALYQSLTPEEMRQVQDMVGSSLYESDWIAAINMVIAQRAGSPVGNVPTGGMRGMGSRGVSPNTGGRAGGVETMGPDGQPRAMAATGTGAPTVYIEQLILNGVQNATQLIDELYALTR